MTMTLSGAPLRLFAAAVAAVSLAVACADVKKPTAPTATSYPTVTITAGGIAKDGPALIPGMPIKVVNADTVVHRLHLDLGAQPGCANIDSGDIQPGESKMTAAVDVDVTACAVHDHMHHGDARFQVKLSADSGE
jgi:hypothetical protein